jgi:ribosome-binding protein aMBF1 (putative translation factor)
MTKELVEKRLERACKVRVRLAELNRTQVWLADEIGVKPRVVYYILQGRLRGSNQLPLMEKALGIKLD